MVEEQKQNMNLSAVRLCFQAYLPDDSGCFTKALPPCISAAVYDSSEINNTFSSFECLNDELSRMVILTYMAKLSVVYNDLIYISGLDFSFLGTQGSVFPDRMLILLSLLIEISTEPSLLTVYYSDLNCTS